jgi:polygalacturonase
MGLTHFPHGVSSFGVPVLGSPTLVPGAKVFFVDGTNGNDSNAGEDPEEAFKTITKAVAECTDDQGDTILVMPGAYAELVVVDKSRVRLYGFNNCVGGPWMVRINPASSTSTTATITVKARDVEIAGLCVAGNHDAGYNTASIFLDGDNEGTRAYVHNCTIEQLTPANGVRSDGIKVVGDRHTITDCLFDSCYQGLYILGGATATTYEILVERCTFRACDVGIFIENGVTSGTGMQDVTVKYCDFDGTGAYSETDGIRTTGTGIGTLIRCNFAGYTDDIDGISRLIENYSDASGGTKLTS